MLEWKVVQIFPRASTVVFIIGVMIFIIAQKSPNICTTFSRNLLPRTLKIAQSGQTACWYVRSLLYVRRLRGAKNDETPKTQIK